MNPLVQITAVAGVAAAAVSLALTRHRDTEPGQRIARGALALLLGTLVFSFSAAFYVAKVVSIAHMLAVFPPGDVAAEEEIRSRAESEARSVWHCGAAGATLPALLGIWSISSAALQRRRNSNGARSSV